MNKQAKWEEDGVGCGGHYLDTAIDGLRAGVHERGYGVECHIWTPGCGFQPLKSEHETVEAAKAYAEQRLSVLTGGRA